jgi:hypothetical protein
MRSPIDKGMLQGVLATGRRPDALDRTERETENAFQGQLRGESGVVRGLAKESGERNAEECVGAG